MSEQRYIQYGTSRIDYELRFAERKTLEISVHPDLRVSVVAPEDTSHDAIEAKVKKRAGWILKQQRELELYLPHVPPRQYVSGETHRYLGRQYRLKIEKAKVKPENRAVLKGGRLVVSPCEDGTPAQVEKLVTQWYRRQAERVFPERLAAMLPRFDRVGPLSPKLVIRRMEKRWGSCTEAGVVTLNLRLMQVPKSCIDYVIVHELCHLVEHNHSRRFYALLQYVMVDWKNRRSRLNEFKIG